MYTLFLFSAGSCSYADHIRHGRDVLCAAARSRGPWLEARFYVRSGAAE